MAVVAHEMESRRRDVHQQASQHSDGQRFLITVGEQDHPTSAVVLLNWFE